MSTDFTPTLSPDYQAIVDFMRKRRPPKEIREQVDIAFSHDNDTIEICEMRPMWTHRDVLMKTSIAKAVKVKAKNNWKVYWMKSDLKWHIYEPEPTVKNVAEFLTRLLKYQMHL